MGCGRKLPHIKVIFHGTWVSQVDNKTHVGNYISIDTIPVNNVCNEMYSKLNLLYWQFSKCSSYVLHAVFNSYCMSLYGSQLWELQKYVSDGVFVYIASRKCVRRKFKILYNTHCKLVNQDTSV